MERERKRKMGRRRRREDGALCSEVQSYPRRHFESPALKSVLGVGGWGGLRSWKESLLRTDVFVSLGPS